MCGTSKYAAEHYPKISSRTKEDAHDGTEDGACARDVEKLYEKHTPGGHGNIVHPIGLGKAGSGTLLIDPKDLLHHCPIYQIAQYQGKQRNTKCNHI